MNTTVSFITPVKLVRLLSDILQSNTSCLWRTAALRHTPFLSSLFKTVSSGSVITLQGTIRQANCCEDIWPMIWKGLYISACLQPPASYNRARQSWLTAAASRNTEPLACLPARFLLFIAATIFWSSDSWELLGEGSYMEKWAMPRRK